MHNSQTNTSDAQNLMNANNKQRLKFFAYFLIACITVALSYRVWVRYAHAQSLQLTSTELARQYVKVTTPQSNNTARHIELPGTLKGFIEAPIYARSTGYLLRYHKDIGEKASKGDLLAELDTPEIDQQLIQAQANRRQMVANFNLANDTLKRWEQLRLQQTVSVQEFDEYRNRFAQAQANLEASNAEVERLQHLAAFKRIRAPFTGILTKRNVDVGDLIIPGTRNPNEALFLLSQTDQLKVHISVPQRYATKIKQGQSIDIRQSEHLDKIIKGTIARTAGAIDTASHSMQIEIVLPNTDGHLLPGAFVTVSLAINTDNMLTIPSNSLIINSQGLHVATVGADNSKVKLQAVSIGRDFGDQVEILAGLQMTDQYILNPPDSLNDGDTVVATNALAQNSTH